ncbi:methyltransferase [Nakamurella silvestris]|nr:methyltransferase [Nakamurella silvestris]
MGSARVVDLIGEDLRSHGFDAETVPEFLGESAHQALGRGDRIPALRATGDGSPLSTLIRLYLLGQPVSATAAAAAFPTAGVDAVVAMGALERGGDEIRAGLDIRPHADEDHSYLVVSDLDSDVRPGPVRHDHVLGIGAASINLVRATIREAADRVLDLGTGCGIQALHAYAHAGSVTATDTNPRALALAAATARLNGQHWDLRLGSLFDPVAGETFDQIISNPPFVISAGEQRFSYRDSGIAGDGLVEQIVRQAGSHLVEGGTAQFLANWLIHEDTDWRQRLVGWLADAGCDAWVVQREVADPAEYVALWLRDAGEQSGNDAVAGDWLEYFSRNKVSGIGMGSITLRRTAGRPDLVLDEIKGAGEEVTGEEAAAFLARRAWLSARSDEQLLASTLSLSSAVILEQRSLPDREGWTTVLRMIRRPGGPGATLQLDEWGQALLSGCRGQVPLSLLIELLAAANGFDEQALTDAVLPSVRQAITRGILHPVQG